MVRYGIVRVLDDRYMALDDVYNLIDKIKAMPEREIASIRVTSVSDGSVHFNFK